jgi:lipoate---protein ligase
MIEILKYNLPDISILGKNWPDNKFFTWIPGKMYIILGQSNNPENSIISKNVLEDNVSVYKRPSGGESVLITPNTLVISTLLTTSKLENPSIYFRTINQQIIYSLSKCNIINLSQNGISDISIGEKKILGSSIYRTQNKVFYHAVLNVSEPVASIEKYLKHPVKEPGYRKGRPHHEFVTSLFEQGYKFNPGEIATLFLNTSL